MDKPSDKPSPMMCRALRQAQLYGYLVNRSDRLYHPGASHPVCSIHTAREMVRCGWLTAQGDRYSITTEGSRRVEEELSH
jgi:hypothetical protein